MSKNLDLKNIFESYYNNVVLGEAVIPVEVDENGNETPDTGAAGNMPSAETLKATRERLRQQRAQELIAQKNAMQSQGIKPGTTVYTTPKGSASPISTQPVADNGTTTQPTTQQPTTQQPTTQQPTTQQPRTQPTTQQPTTQPVQSQNNDASDNEDEWDTVETQVVGSYPVGAAGNYNFGGSTVSSSPVAMSDEELEQNDEDESDDDEGYEEVETTVERIPNASTTTSIAAGDDEIKPYHKKIQEKINISKFLKHLSEKNYSSAHKYLKAIVEDKVKTKIAQRIAKI
jgi:hypothetical protein